MTSQKTAAVPLYLQSHVFLVTKSRGLWGGGSSGDENERHFKVSNQPETSGYPGEASHSTPLHDCSYPLFWQLYGYYPVKWTDHSSYGKEIWQIRKTKQKQRIEKTSSDNAKLNTSLLSCLQESLQKEQRYKTWKSISSIYRGHPHFKTNTHGNPPIFSDRWYTTENKVHSKTDRQLYWWTEVSIGHSHDRTPTQQDLRVTLNRTPTLVTPTIPQKAHNKILLL